MRVTCSPAAALPRADRETIGLGLFEEPSGHTQALKPWPSLAASVQRILRLGDFKGRPKESLVVYPEQGPTKRVLLVGLGKRADFNGVKALQAAATVSRKAKTLGLARVAFALPPATGEDEALVEGLAQGALLGVYSFDRFKEKPQSPKVALARFTVAASRRAGWLDEACRTGRVIGDAVAFVRDLATLPSNFKTPTMIASQTRAMARKAGLSCRILGRADMARLGMDAILGVARGSAEPPVFVILEHKPRRVRAKGPVVLVGKGITFDTGGISIKPADNMHHMKDDMQGGAVVLGTLKVCAELKVPVHVVGLVPFTENMPGGRAQKPGDIVRALNGKTIEVMNTDAEGRLILADALAYAERYKPAALVDMATLTGAAGVALGRFAIGAMGTDQRLVDRLKEAGEISGERIWQLPLWDDYLELMRGEAADLKNTGGREAGTITAGAFLKEFGKHAPWCHLDIAAGAWGQEDKPWQPKGPTGNGLRLMVQFLRDWK
jgi:leucyl aminopeptidase